MTIGTIFCNQCGGQNPTAAQFCSNCGADLANSLPVSNRAAVNGIAVAVPSQIQSAQGEIAPPTIAVPAAQYGGFWIRFIAAVIDGIVVQAVVMPVAFIVGLLVGVAGVAMNSVGQGVNLVPVFFGAGFGLFGSWMYEAMMESSSRQATLGKMVFGMKVTDLQANRISFARATARHFSKYLSAMILMLGYIMAGFTAQKQALHDMIAGTVVRRGWR